MTSELNQKVELSLSKSACLVLFELLSVSYEKWRKDNPDDALAGPMPVIAADQAERAALWQLEGALELTLPELFSSNYEELLKQSKRLLTNA